MDAVECFHEMTKDLGLEKKSTLVNLQPSGFVVRLLPICICHEFNIFQTSRNDDFQLLGETRLTPRRLTQHSHRF